MGKKVLVVDDSKSMRDLASMTLEVLGDYESEQAADGVEAKEKLQSGDYDLVLTDLDMPHMGGDELIAWMRSDEKVKDVPVIVLTAGVDKIRSEIAGRYEISGYLEKPFQPQQLSEAVEKALGPEA
jgi:two-component system, chemotaxis family, chemotaxis protein CheY